jgi:hypothetical protein
MIVVGLLMHELSKCILFCQTDFIRFVNVAKVTYVNGLHRLKPLILSTIHHL